MRMSRAFGATLREVPAGVEDPGHGLLLRAGYVRRLAPGLFGYLPLGRRTLARIEALARSEISATGALEVSMPLIQPAALWERSGNLSNFGAELVRFRDRHDRPMVVAASNEEAAAELFRSEVESYRQLPISLFQIRRSFRDEEHLHAGLLRAREFTLLDSYTFARDAAQLTDAYRAHRDAFERILARMRLPDGLVIGADSAPEDGSIDQELVYPLEGADDEILFCADCGYADKHELARFARPPSTGEDPAPLQKVATPGAETIASLAEFLSIPVSRTAKVVFFSGRRHRPTRRGAERALLMAVVRGDMEVSEAKLRAATDTSDLRPAEVAEIRSVGAEPGYGSPVGLDSDGLIVAVDELVATSPNLVSGANEEGYHLINVNHGRDYVADVVGDLSRASAGEPCLECGGPLRPRRVTELASLHRFPGTFGERLGLSFQDETGAMTTPRLASYGMGLDRVLGCVAAVHRDEHGLRLPAAIAPFQIALVSLPSGHAEIAEKAEELYEDLTAAGWEVIYDDRDTSPGVKFNDADLIGIPARLTLGTRSLERGGVELKRRDEEERVIVPLKEVDNVLRRRFAPLTS